MTKFKILSISRINADYEDFNAEKSVLDNDVRKIEEKLSAFALKVNEIGETVEAMMAYSYQYNLRILGIPRADANESAQESVELCLRLFKELKANVKEYDIDIAHRLQSRDSTRPAAIVCKFTRRVAKEAVMSKRRELRNVNLKNVVSCTEALDNPQLAIYDHLTPRKQELLKQAKALQREKEFAYCWVKNSNILMRESASSRTIRINSTADLDKLKTTGNFRMSCSPEALSGRGRGEGHSRGAGVGLRTS